MRAIDVCMAVAVAVIWGMGFVVAKSATEHFPPIFLMSLRFFLTALCLVWFYRPPIKFFKQIFWIALVSATIQYGLTFNGLAGIDASTAALVVQLEVPFGVLMAWIVFGERMNLRQIIGMLIAFVGTVFIVGEPTLEGRVIYIFLVIGGAFTWAIGQVMIKKLGEVGGFVLIAWVAAIATPQMFIASWILESDQIMLMKTASWSVWGAVVYLALIMTALGYAMWYHLLGRYDVNKVMPFLLLLPVSAVLGGVFFLGETLTLNIVVGGLFSIFGVALITIQFEKIFSRTRAN